MVTRLKIEELESPDWLKQKYLREGLSTRKIGKLLGCSREPVLRRLEEFGVQKRGTASCPSWNDKFFDILSPDSAYIIGFLIADGSIRKRGANNNYALTFAQKEREILEKIGIIVDAPTVRHRNNMWWLTLCSKHAWALLTDRFGIPAGKKSHIVRIPDCILDRDDLIPHCIRGIFDGDGFVREDGIGFNFASCSLVLLNEIARVIARFVPSSIGPKWYHRRTGLHILSYGSLFDSIGFAQFIYDPYLDVYGSTLYLERKRARFQSACEKWHGREWLCEQIKHGKTSRDIAVEIGSHINIVTRVLNRMSVYDFPYKDHKWLQSEFVHNGRSVQDIAKTYDVESADVKYYINKYGLHQERSKYWNLELGI